MRYLSVDAAALPWQALCERGSDEASTSGRSWLSSSSSQAPPSWQLGSSLSCLVLPEGRLWKASGGRGKARKRALGSRPEAAAPFASVSSGNSAWASLTNAAAPCAVHDVVIQGKRKRQEECKPGQQPDQAPAAPAAKSDAIIFLESSYRCVRYAACAVEAPCMKKFSDAHVHGHLCAAPG